MNKRKLFSDSFKLIYEEISECLTHHNETEVSRIDIDLKFMRKQRGIYESLNKFHIQGATLIAECWVPRIYLTEVNDLVELKNFDNHSLVRKMIKGEMQVLTQNFSEVEKMELSPPS